MFRVLITGSSTCWLEWSLPDDTEHELLSNIMGGLLRCSKPSNDFSHSV